MLLNQPTQLIATLDRFDHAYGASFRRSSINTLTVHDISMMTINQEVYPYQ